MVVVLPGDVVPDAAPTPDELKVGPGVLPTPNAEMEAPASLTAIRSGALGHVRNKQRSSEHHMHVVHGWWVESARRRYVPATGDRVIGQITNRGVESYTVTLFSAHTASLPVLAFEGATRRNRPDLKIGALVYARVVGAEPWTEPELSCVDPVTSRAEGMGELKAGDDSVAMVWSITPSLAQSMLRPQHSLLKHVATHFPFEAATGANGLVWVRTTEAAEAISLGRVLHAADAAAAEHGLAGDATSAETAEPESLLRRIGMRGELTTDAIAACLLRE